MPKKPVASSYLLAMTQKPETRNKKQQTRNPLSSSMQPKQIAIIGGGPAGLMAADVLSPFHHVRVYEKEKAIGQKFLVAGTGGLNITNGLTGETLAAEYTPAGFLKDAICDFDSLALREWMLQLGIPTYEGSSKRVFPEKGITPAEVLKKIRLKLEKQGVEFYPKHAFSGFGESGDLNFKSGRNKITVHADYSVFALGGASWPVTGSTGDWLKYFEKQGIKTLPFQASNCGIHISWPENIIANHAGKPLKNAGVSVNGVYRKGEAIITEYGLEGNVIYPLVPEIRKSLNSGMPVSIILDLKPFNTGEQLLAKVAAKSSARTKNYAELFNLNNIQLSVIKAFTSREVFLSPELFAASLKQIQLPVQALRPIGEAISTVGGIDLEEMNSDFSFKKMPQCFAIGEMLDWDAPTGGFLLQGCFSMGHWVGKKILEMETFSGHIQDISNV
jgi:uncharacterized flavoprotein (TIGR03862 family)